MVAFVVIYILCYFCFFFFFQAEDGIRDVAVTGVQTCALPILDRWWRPRWNSVQSNAQEGKTSVQCSPFSESKGKSRLSAPTIAVAVLRRIGDNGSKALQPTILT